MGYTIFPNGGWRPSTPHILERIEEKDGTLVWSGKQQSIRKIVTKPETAYEVNSCLVDALKSGTGKPAYTEFGLKKFPAAGKTGTAYDFTDALFAGYDSNFTCAVWAGFDKPQKIYRGAFGRELALPVWVDIMNAAAQSYPPREIKQPSTLKQIEICSRSGQLATDKCYDAVKSANGDTVQRRTTYMDPETYDTITLAENLIGDAKDYLVENLSVQVLYAEGKAVEVELPASVSLKVVESAEGLRGDTASNVTKPAKLETGKTINVPLFIKEGEAIKIDTRTGGYMGRA